MNIVSKNMVRWIILGLLFVLTIFIPYKIYLAYHFRLVSTTPSARNKVATSTKSMVLNFNKQIKPNSLTMSNVNSTNSLVSSISIENKKVTLKFDTLQKDTEYNITINNVYSGRGDEINKISLNFKAKYVPYGDLSKAEQQLQFDATNTPSISNILPHETENYYADFYSCPENKTCISIEMKFQVPESYYNNPRYLADVKKYRTEAIDYIKQAGLNIKDYTIVYSEPVLLNQEPKGLYLKNTEEYTGDGSPPEDRPAD